MSQIVKLKVENKWIGGVDEIKGKVRRNFGKQYEEYVFVRLNLEGIEFKKVEEAVWSCKGDKSPGPDGFNFAFIKACWGTIKEEVFGLLVQFHENRKLLRAFATYFVDLIGKIKNLQELKDFRPISLVRCIYNIIAKVLAARHKRVLPGIISAS